MRHVSFNVCTCSFFRPPKRWTLSHTTTRSNQLPFSHQAQLYCEPHCRAPSWRQVRVSTLQRRLSAIREAHFYRGIKVDTSSAAFRDVWRGIRRTHGVPANKKVAVADSGGAPSDCDAPKHAGGATGPGNAYRVWCHAAEVGIGSAGGRAAGRSLRPDRGNPSGLAVDLGATKTDQTGEGDVIGIPYGTNVETCPVRSYQAWLAISGITTGPAFRAIDRHGHMSASSISDKAVATIVKRAVVAGEISGGATVAEATATAARFAGHSLRAGLATSAAANDAPGHAIQRQLRHKRFDTTQGYIRSSELFKKNAAGMAGL
jgi:hypothetical protein